jgi:hypothetical protein
MFGLHSLARLRGLAPSERRLLAAALVMLPIAGASLRALGLRRTQRLLLRAPARLKRTPVSPVRAGQIVRAAAERGPYCAKCLAASLTLQALLLRSGVRTSLRLGVRKGGAGIEAHAWVELDGEVLMEPQGSHRHFSAFDGAIGATKA